MADSTVPPSEDAAPAASSPATSSHPSTPAAAEDIASLPPVASLSVLELIEELKQRGCTEPRYLNPGIYGRLKTRKAEACAELKRLRLQAASGQAPEAAQAVAEPKFRRMYAVWHTAQPHAETLVDIDTLPALDQLQDRIPLPPGPSLHKTHVIFYFYLHLFFPGVHTLDHVFAFLFWQASTHWKSRTIRMQWPSCCHISLAQRV